ncbi:Myb-like DNA-binding domain containing protein [Leishmania donovani]|uniref:Myb-like_DNA-binding_domain_containing_protein_pu tative/Pfam:PF00249/Pfam:PF13921 n=1 Tax=Leishmania donovani TaxID=5661 RepID=A0A6J8F8J8_LEIDO|nr:Myb-like DNA-binding domain containing protein [Leishmania donovani]VDZ43752.1 Myb-like_DNA-binding_domain_containing_protein_putative/Pfam:PF00249/Pfam:PF13921 [Leishmania donovani]
MSRLHFKGGAWTNAEDEVMKAALAQYGLRDWERVASMLTKKTAMQCRERWENYLDPRLNIHEAWSLEEEEKLVELQALFPHKWRLISEQLTRRTPNHYIRPAWLCEQRYLELKDEQEYYLKQQQQQLKDAPGGAAGEKQSLESFMAERRRRRIARKTHEERASRADTISGERCEREMIDMATSRLANQDQKKGLRKERQQQLAEAAFLAKLESNREGIESGTLSLRQTRKMKKALEEDRQKPGLVDEIEEADEEDYASGEARDSGEDDDNDEQFEAIDMYEDQKQAGLVKKQRVLMKDLTEQQRHIQQRQMSSAAGAGGDEEATASSIGSSRARAALTGVNQDLLRQLTSAPTSASPSLLESNAFGTRAITAAGKPVTGANSIAAAAAAEAKEELKSTLDNLFATLPSAARAAPGPTLTSFSADMPPPLPLPPLKRPREALKPVSVTGEEDRDASYPREVAQQRAPEPPSRPAGSSSSAEARRSDNGVPAHLFGALDIPAPRKMPKTDAAATAAVYSNSGASRSDEARAPIHTNAGPSDAVANSTSAADAQYGITFTESEAEMYMLDARRWVAVECERATAAAETSKAPEDEQPTPAEIHAAQSLIEQELCSTDRTATDGASMANGGGTKGATQLQHSSSMAAAVRAYTSVGGLQAYGSHVNVQQALHQLSQRVAAQVQEANAILQPLRQEWEQVMSTAMLSPQDRHVLYGYVRDDGQLKGSPAVGNSAEDDEGEGLPPPSVAAYVCERIISQLQRARLASRFTKELRDREVLKMRRDLDEAEHDLQQLQSRERTLQDMYRHQRAQQL